MQVSVSLTVQVPSTATIEEIEEACVAASRRAGREAMGEIIGPDGARPPPGPRVRGWEATDDPHALRLPHLHTYRAMGPGSWMHGSAPAEKHIELTVNRRFERRGMRWSRDGARRLLAIRLEVIAAR